MFFTHTRLTHLRFTKVFELELSPYKYARYHGPVTMHERHSKVRRSHYKLNQQKRMGPS